MENYYKLPVAVWENGNVPSVTDTVTCFCIGFGKNINGQKTYPVAPLPIPISLFLIIHHFLFFCNLFPPVYYTGIVVGCIKYDIIIRHLIHHLIVGCVSSRLPYPHPFVMVGESHDIF